MTEYLVHPIILKQFAGLRTAVAADKLQPNEAAQLQNLETVTGDLRTRNGWQKKKSAKIDGTRPLLGNWRTIKVSTMVGKEILHTRNKMWTISGSSVASITGGYSFTSGHAHTLAVYQDTVYGGNGVDTGWKYTFTGKMSSDSTPSEAFAFVDVFEEKLVRARGTTNKDRFEWTDEGLPTTRQALSFDFYPPDRTDELTLMRPLAGEIVFGTRWRIGKTVGGLPPHAIVDIPTGLGRGCVSHYSSAVVDGWLYYVGLKGIVYRTDGNVVQDVTTGILDTSDIKVPTSHANSRFLRGCGRDGRFYDLFYPSVGTSATFPDRILTYDAIEQRWYGPHVGMRVATAFEWRTPGDSGKVTGGTPSGHSVTLWSGNSDNGAVITGIYKGPIFSAPDGSHRKTFDEFEVQGAQIASGTARLGIYLDRKSSASTVANVALKASGSLEGDRDATTVTRTYLYEPKKVTWNMTAREYQPKVRIQAKGQATISAIVLKVKMVRTN